MQKRPLSLPPTQTPAHYRSSGANIMAATANVMLARTKMAGKLAPAVRRQPTRS